MICRTSVQDGSKIRLDARVELPFKIPACCYALVRPQGVADRDSKVISITPAGPKEITVQYSTPGSSVRCSPQRIENGRRAGNCSRSVHDLGTQGRPSPHPHSLPSTSKIRMQSECLISGYSVAGRKYFRGTRPSQESCELAGKADFPGWIFDSVARSGLFWRQRQMGKLMSKSEMIEKIAAENSELSKKQVKGVIESLATVGYKELKKNGAFVVPGFAKFVVIKRPATKERNGINPFTKEPTVFKAKPARKIVRARPVKAAKDAV
jgi:DNA-binding protein HU-beta